MNTKIISETEIAPLRIASLPSRPTAPTAFGGRGYTASDMKAAFDKLPLLVISRLNSLLEEIESGGLSEVILNTETGIKDGHTLGDLLTDIESGALAGYLNLGDENLTDTFEGVYKRIVALEERPVFTQSLVEHDGGTPAERIEEEETA